MTAERMFWVTLAIIIAGAMVCGWMDKRDYSHFAPELKVAAKYIAVKGLW